MKKDRSKPVGKPDKYYNNKGIHWANSSGTKVRTIVTKVKVAP